MDFTQVKELLALLENSSVGEFLYENEGVKIRYRSKDYAKKVQVQQSPTAFMAAPSPMMAAPAAAPPAVVASPQTQEEQPATKPSVKASEGTAVNYKEIRSPMVGTFYRSASPEKPPFVKVGDSITADTTVCLVEAMKLFNEIKAEMAGQVVKVLVEDGAPVEYDQVLFLVEAL